MILVNDASAESGAQLTVDPTKPVGCPSVDGPRGRRDNPGAGVRRLFTALLLLAATLAVLGALFQIVYRPWQRNWGSTAEEVARRMPGDELITAPEFVATRAVTIRGRPEEIWPWLVQIGYRRAGFYSYDRLDNDGIPSAERILPEYQQLAVGDEIPLSNAAGARVQAVEPGRSLLLAVGRDPELPGAFTWAWGLYPEDDERTRLVTRLRWRAPGAASRVLMDATEIWMMRKCLLGIKRRVESSWDPAAPGTHHGNGAGARRPAGTPSAPAGTPPA